MGDIFHGYCWYVEYDYEFRSSAGMDKYSIPHHESLYIITAADSISELGAMIQSMLTCQEHLIKVTQADFKGDGICQGRAKSND